MFNTSELLQLRKESMAIKALLEGDFESAFKDLEDKAKYVEDQLGIKACLEDSEKIRSDAQAFADKATADANKQFSDLADQKNSLDEFEANLKTWEANLKQKEAVLNSMQADLNQAKDQFNQFMADKNAGLDARSKTLDDLKLAVLQHEQDLSAQTDKVNASIQMLRTS